MNIQNQFVNNVLFVHLRALVFSWHKPFAQLFEVDSTFKYSKSVQPDNIVNDTKTTK